MIEGGFFNCNVGDRVICLYCNLICQQWNPHTDDPCEVHKTLSPNCIYVKTKLIHPSASSIFRVDENSTTIISNLELSRSHEIVLAVACNPSYTELPKRHASSLTWPNENLSPIDTLVRAGFFYIGTKAIVTCFYCNGSLLNCDANDNPLIKHARLFPHCAYAKRLCGNELYETIQEAQRTLYGIDELQYNEIFEYFVLLESARTNEMRTRPATTIDNRTANRHQLIILDEDALSTLIQAQLDLPVSQRLWNNGDNFASDSDLYIACLILQKQIKHINGTKENIVIPSLRIKQIDEQNVPKTKQLLSENRFLLQRLRRTRRINRQNENKSNDAIPSNPCVLCLSEEKKLACIRCEHLATCVPYGHSLRSCPICRRGIEAFVRIHI